MQQLVRRAAQVGAGAAVTMAAAQVLPAATWIPVVRRLVPALRGQGLGDHVALTFDDGPDPTSTPLLLDVLADQRVRATFFVLGERLADAPDLGRDIARRGHELAVHGWSHDYLLARTPGSVLTDLRRTAQLVQDVTGRQPRWFRPPYGVLTGAALVASHQAALRPVLWSAWGRDWTEDADAASITATVLAGLSPGGTILLHESPVGGSLQADVRIRAALPELINACHAQGLRIGPLAEHW